MKNIFSKILFFSPFLLIFLFLIYHYRFVYQTPFDEKYARDLFDHSQYRIPKSPRSISDELLYQVAGVDYLKTGNLFDINPEKAPLAKYFYGLSIIFFKNAQIISIFIFLITFIVYFHLVKLFIRNNFLIFLCLLIFITEPLVYSQMAIAMLELPEVLFFLVHVYFFLRLLKIKKLKKSNLLDLLIAGISLGAFTSIRFGLFAAVLIFVDFILALRKKMLPLFFSMTIFSILFYILIYFPYFLAGNNFISFLKAQKWIFHHYLDSWRVSNIKTIYGSIFIYFLTGFNKGWYEGTVWERIHEWTIFWPVYILIFFIQLKQTLIFTKKFIQEKINDEEIKNLYINLLITFFVGLMIFIPVFVRYLLLLFPFLILNTIKEISKFKKINFRHKALIIIFLSIYSIQQLYYLNPSPNSVIKEITRQWQNGTFQDVYDLLKIKDEKIDRVSFWRRMKLIEKELGIDKKRVLIGLKENFYPWKNKLKGEIFISLNTRIGKIDNRSETEFIKEKGRWKMIWQDRYLIPNLDQDDQVIGNFELGKYGKILLKDGTILSDEEKRPFFLVIQKEITDDKKLQLQLAKLTGKGGTFDIEIIYRPNSLPDVPTEIGFIKEDYNLSDFNKIKLEEGVIYEMRTTRVYYPNLKKGYPIDLIKKIAWQNRNIIDPEWGGRIMIKKKNGELIVIKEKIKKDGKDIIL